MITPKKDSNINEGLRRCFNFMLYYDLCKGPNGYKYLESKMEAEALAREWFGNNLEGLPEQLKEEVEEK